MEFEFIALEKACGEAKWLLKIFSFVRPVPAVFIHCDNVAPIHNLKPKYIKERVGIRLHDILL